MIYATMFWIAFTIFCVWFGWAEAHGRLLGPEERAQELARRKRMGEKDFDGNPL